MMLLQEMGAMPIVKLKQTGNVIIQSQFQIAIVFVVIVLSILVKLVKMMTSIVEMAVILSAKKNQVLFVTW